MRSTPSVLPLRWSWRLGRVYALGALLGCLGAAGAQDASAPARGNVPTRDGQAPAASSKEKDAGIKLETPSPEKLFQLQGERAFLDAVRRDLREVTKTTELPKDAVPPRPRERAAMPPAQEYFVPNVVCYHPLYFEQAGPERHAEYVPYVQCLISACRFYTDAALLPVKKAIQPPWSRECNDDDPSRGPDPLAPVRR